MKNCPFNISKFLLIVLVVTTGCSVNSIEDFSCEAEAVCRDICKELAKIESREDFAKISPKLQKHFNELVDLMIAMRQFQEKYPDEGECVVSEKWYSVTMQSELERIYTMEGGRSMVEKAQKEALLRLDAFERNLKKQKSGAYNKLH